MMKILNKNSFTLCCLCWAILAQTLQAAADPNLVKKYSENNAQVDISMPSLESAKDAQAFVEALMLYN